MGIGGAIEFVGPSSKKKHGVNMGMGLVRLIWTMTR